MTAKSSKYGLSEGAMISTCIANLLGHVPVTKIRVHSSIVAESLRRTTLHQTDIYRNLSLAAPELSPLIDVWNSNNRPKRQTSNCVMKSGRLVMPSTDISLPCAAYQLQILKNWHFLLTCACYQHQTVITSFLKSCAILRLALAPQLIFNTSPYHSPFPFLINVIQFSNVF